METKTTFDLTQSLFLFNWAANAADLGQLATEQQLADYIYYYLNGETAKNPNPFPEMKVKPLIKDHQKDLAGQDWELVWGPGVFSLEKNNHTNTDTVIADNSAYVLYSKNLNTHVVAIAGTDAHSILDWVEEDFQVGPNDCFNWSDIQGITNTTEKPTSTVAVEDNKQVSLGTAIGIWGVLTQLKQASGSPAPNQTLLQFLEEKLKPQSGGEDTRGRFIFTGHSLGGALSPTLARWACDRYYPTGVPDKQTNILAMPTAGPTPGNKTYQDDWDVKLPSVEVTSVYTTLKMNSDNKVVAFNNNVWNRYDVVPRSWDHIIGLKGDYFSYKFDVLTTPWGGLSVQANTITNIAAELTFIGFISGKLHQLEERGKKAYMTRSAHTTEIDVSTGFNYLIPGSREVQPFKFPNNKELYFYPATPGGFMGMFEYISKVHVWGYGQEAFNLPMSIMLDLHPQKP